MPYRHTRGLPPSTPRIPRVAGRDAPVRGGPMPDRAHEEPGSNIRGPEDVVAFLRACDVPTIDRAQIVLGLACTEEDPDTHGLCGAAVRSGDDADRVIDCDQLVALAEELVVCSLVVTTIEPGAPSVPSRSEV